MKPETQLTADELSRATPLPLMRLRHWRVEVEGFALCGRCDEIWPCDADVLFATIDSLRTQLEQAQQDAANLTTDLLQAEARETALREALAGLVAATESERNPDRSAAYKKAVRALSGEGR